MAQQKTGKIGVFIVASQSKGSEPELVRNSLGFWQLAAPPSEDDLSSYYSESYYQQEKAFYRHSYSPQELRLGRKRLSRQVDQCLALLTKSGSNEFLDVGCGEGWALAEFHARKWNVTGLDFSVAGVARMNPRMKDRVRQGDIFRTLGLLREEGRSFDVIWLDHVLEHVLEPELLLLALRDIVARGGRMMIRVPNDGNALHSTLLADGLISRRWWIKPPDHLSYFTKESFPALFDSTGWQVDTLSSSFPIDWFIANRNSNYVEQPERGREAYEASLLLEEIIESNPIEKVQAFYGAMAEIGLGRDIVVYVQAKDADTGNRASTF